MTDSRAATEQTRQKRALQKENSTGSSSKSLEAAIRWSAEVLGCEWHAELQQVQPTLIKVVQHGCNQLPKKVTDEPLLLHSVVSHRKVIAYRAVAHDGSADPSGGGGGSGASGSSNGGSTLGGSGSRGRSSTADAAALQQQLQLDEQRRFSIPLAYEGWFEILNEDGQAAPPFARVSQLAEALPRAFLVRDKCKAYYCSDASASVAGREPAPDKSRTVHGGELMAVVGVTTAMLGWRRRRKRSLHCLDEAGSALYFDCDSRCSFSAVASASGADVVGVHRIATIADTFRMPLTVRSVGGRKACAGAAGPGAPGCFRLTEVRTDEVALLLPLRTGGSLVPVSARTRLQVVAAENRAELQARDDFAALQRACSGKAEAYFKTIQVLISTDRRCGGSSTAQPRTSSGSEAPPDGRHFSRTFSHEEDWVPPPLPSLPLPPTPTRRRASVSSEASEQADSLGRSQPSSEEDLLFDEVDDLYDYVRRGGEPPKPRPRSWANQGGSGGGSPAGGDGLPPPERRLDDDGRSSSQPILSSNGVMRGRLAELTCGRFPRHSSRSSPAMAAASMALAATPAAAAATGTVACDNMAPAASDENRAAAAAATSQSGSCPPSSPFSSSSLAVPGTAVAFTLAAETGANAAASPPHDGSSSSRCQRLAIDDRNDDDTAADTADEHHSMLACGGASLASTGSMTSSHSQAHLCASKPDLTADDSDGDGAENDAQLLASRLLLLPAHQQKRSHSCSEGFPLLVVSDGDSVANANDLPIVSGGRHDDGEVATAAASPVVVTVASTIERSSCSTPESGAESWESHDSGSSLAMDRLRVPSQGFDATLVASSRRCSLGAAGSTEPLSAAPAAAAVHDGRYATLSHPSAAASRRAKLTQTPYRSTGDLVQLFEKLTTAAATTAATAAAGDAAGCGGSGLHPSVLTLRRRSHGGVLSEGRLPLRTPPSEPEDFDTGSKTTMSDSIRRRITTLKLSARTIMV